MLEIPLVLTNFIPIALKIVLVEFVLVETRGDSLYAPTEFFLTDCVCETCRQGKERVEGENEG